MLCRPSRQAHARRIDNDRKRKSGDINGDINKEEVLVLTTEFNFNYRVHDGVWISCRDLQVGLVQTPVLITSLLSPEGNAGICAVNAIYLYNGAYLRSTLMDYSHLIPDAMVGNNVWFLANKPVEITGARLSSAWLGVPVGMHDGSRMVSEPPISASPWWEAHAHSGPRPPATDTSRQFDDSAGIERYHDRAQWLAGGAHSDRGRRAPLDARDIQAMA